MALAIWKPGRRAFTSAAIVMLLMAAGHTAGFHTAAPSNPVEEKLFADMGEPTEGALGVKRTKIAAAFPRIGHVMTFLFDYGDDWLFKIQLISVGQRAAKQRYPRVVASKGMAPEQYPALEGGDE